MTYTNSADMQHCLHNTNNATTALTLHKPATDAATQIIIIIQSARKYSKYKLGTSFTKRAVYLRCDMKTPVEEPLLQLNIHIIRSPTVEWTSAQHQSFVPACPWFASGAATALISGIR